MAFSLENKVVFITGASSGIGAACAKLFAQQKAKLLLCARREDKLINLSNSLQNKYAIDIYCFQLDVRDNKTVTEKINQLPPSWKAVDVLINNAGLARGFNKLYEGLIEDWEEMIDTNIKGLLYITRQILPDMVKRNQGHIINIGSVAGHEAYPNGNVYCATKFAVNALSKSLRFDLLGTNIRVSTVDPGMTETEFSITRFHGDEARARNVYQGMQPLTPDDIADAVLYCASRPEYVNINEIILTPTAQASATMVSRS